MATINVKFWPSAVIGVEGTLYYSITHERRVRQQLSGCKLLSSEWDVRHADIVIPPAARGANNSMKSAKTFAATCGVSQK